MCQRFYLTQFMKDPVRYYKTEFKGPYFYILVKNVEVNLQNKCKTNKSDSCPQSNHHLHFTRQTLNFYGQ